MRNSCRIPEVLKLLEQKWIESPDLRFFQFVEYIKMKLSKEMSGVSSDYFYTEDDDLINALRKE